MEIHPAERICRVHGFDIYGSNHTIGAMLWIMAATTMKAVKQSANGSSALMIEVEDVLAIVCVMLDMLCASFVVWQVHLPPSRPTNPVAFESASIFRELTSVFQNW